MVLFAMPAFSQVAESGLPASFGQRLKVAEILPKTRLDSLSVRELIARDRQEGVQNRYGLVSLRNIDIKKEGLHSLIGEVNCWRFELKSPNAYSLGLSFSTFDVPPGAALYIYSRDKRRIRGGFTDQNVKPSGNLPLGEFEGNELIIEYNEPVNPAFKGGVILGSVSSAYIDLASNAAVRLQINCPDGADWQVQKRAVCLITYRDTKYSYYCSGALVNNVDEDGTPYFLTANHCISKDSEAETAVTYFNYENSTCNSNDAVLSQSVSGASVLATSTHSDFSLLLLDESPPLAYEPLFAGWDATGNTPQSGVCIHHPQGAPKTIAIDDDPLVSNSSQLRWEDNTVSAIGSHWEVTYDVGSDEGGSSGAPLFTEEKRIIGQLHGGDDNTSLFGKFSWSWNYRQEPDRQLKYWLDPDNSGVMVLDEFDSTSKPVAGFHPEVDILCLSERLSLYDDTRYNPDRWTWAIQPTNFNFVNGTNASSQNPEIEFTAEGVYSISLTVSNVNGTDVKTAQNIVSVWGELPVRFVDGADEKTMCGKELNDFQFEVEGAPYYNFETTTDEKLQLVADGSAVIVSLKEQAKSQGSFDSYLKVVGWQGSCQSADSILLHVEIPENDNIDQAIALRLGYNGVFSNECATVQINEPAPDADSCNELYNWCPAINGAVLDNSVWFTFMAPSSGFVTIQTEGIDSQISVYRAANSSYLLSGSKASFTLIGASDQGKNGGGAATIDDLEVIPGAKYWLQVDGTNGDEGELTIHLRTNSIEVFPNPSSGLFHLTIAGKEDGEASLSLYNQLGELRYAETKGFSQNENTLELDFRGFSSGIYYLHAMLNGARMSQKLILLK